MEELKAKIAERCGFRQERLVIPLVGIDRPDGSWVSPENDYNELELPDFTASFDACFEYIVPKWIDIIMVEQECSSDFAYAIMFKKWLQELELNIPHVALALCRAVEKLIDGENAPTSKIPTHCKQIGGSESSALGR